MFNKEATRWLEIWLDNQLKFTSYINEKMKKARTAKVQIKIRNKKIMFNKEATR